LGRPLVFDLGAVFALVGGVTGTSSGVSIGVLVGVWVGNDCDLVTGIFKGAVGSFCGSLL